MANSPDSDFTVFYHLMSLERNTDIRIKVALKEADYTSLRQPVFGPMPTGMNAKRGICLVLPLMVTPFNPYFIAKILGRSSTA